jgi:outer membrane protein OmpA-like peptidoglycan-associated protein
MAHAAKGATCLLVFWAISFGAMFATVEGGGLTVQGSAAPKIPLCPGLTIVTAINQPDGDYESIKTIESVSDEAVRLKYSSERLVSDWLSGDPPGLKKTTVYRRVRREDLKTAKLYQQQFYEKLPETIPETTAIGVSADVLSALKTKGEAELGIFNAFTGEPVLDRNEHPNIFDFQMAATVQRVGAVNVPVLVNDTAVELPAIHAQGDFMGDKSEFFFLDDAENPLTLKFRIGIDAIKPMEPEMAALCDSIKDVMAGIPMMDCSRPRNGGDRDVLQVVKITHRCVEPPAGPSVKPGGASTLPPVGGTTSAAHTLEQALKETGRADVYSIFFSFNSDQIRDESDPTLKEIAELLKRHPDWKLSVEGHTDGIAGDAYNMELSRRRAAAVKDALVKRYKVDEKLLTTTGYGKSRPKDTNDTLEGRARNRRVELVRH